MDDSSVQVMPYQSFASAPEEQEDSIPRVTLAPWQTYRENTGSFLERQRTLRDIYSEQKKSKETSRKPLRWAKSYEPGLFTSGRQCTFSWSIFKSSQNSAHLKAAAPALESYRAPDQALSDDHQAATSNPMHSNVALLPILPTKSSTDSELEYCISPNLAALNECVTLAGWPLDANKHVCQRETNRSHSEFPPINKTRQNTQLDVPLATSPRRGMLEITVPQLSRDRIHDMSRLQEKRKYGLPLLLKMDRYQPKEVARPIRFSELDESLTFGDVESAASALCDRKMKLHRSTTNDFNAQRRTEATSSK